MNPQELAEEFWNMDSAQQADFFNILADIIEENIKFDTEEILDVKWIDIEEIKNMPEEQLRAYNVNMQFIKDFEANKIYPLEIFNND